MELHDILQDKFKRIDSLPVSRNLDERLTHNSKEKEVINAIDQSKTNGEGKGKRNSSFYCSILHNSSIRKRRNHHINTLPPMNSFSILEKEKSRTKMKQDLFKEWKKEDKEKFRYLPEAKINEVDQKKPQK